MPSRPSASQYEHTTTPWGHLCWVSEVGVERLLTTTGLQPTRQKTFVALADTYVRANEPDASFGKNDELRVDDTPVARSYLRFEIFGIPGTIVRATLRLYTSTNSGDGFQVRASGNSWIESRTTYRNAPAVGHLIAQSGSFFANEWVSIDVTPAVRPRSTTLDLALMLSVHASSQSQAANERAARRSSP